MSDNIANLPVDEGQVSPQEVHLVNTFFKENQSKLQSIYSELKETIVAGVLFAIISLPPINGLIQTFVPITEKSPYLLLGIKALLFMIVLYGIKNLYLVRK
jgi:hypothetical protein